MIKQTELRRLIIVIAVCILSVSACDESEPTNAVSEPTIEVNVPEVFEVDRYRSPILLISVTGTDIDPLSEASLDVALLDADGQIVDVSFTNTAILGDVAHGGTAIGIELAESGLADGNYQACVTTTEIDGRACGGFELVFLALNACQEKFEQALKQNPGFGCRCIGGTVRIAAADGPDGNLGAWTAAAGGNTFGNFNRDLPAKFSSLFKFEPHFTIQAVNEPDRPAECSEQQWQELIIGMCTEGQNINKTSTALGGTPNEVNLHLKDGQGNNLPYNDTTRDPSNFKQDGHGYKAELRSNNPAKLVGLIKTHDVPNIAHWLDSPGAFQEGKAPFMQLKPYFRRLFFHTYVHGTTGNKEDNCDCYHGVKDTVFNANGTSGPSVITAIPQCK